MMNISQCDAKLQNTIATTKRSRSPLLGPNPRIIQPKNRAKRPSRHPKPDVTARWETSWSTHATPPKGSGRNRLQPVVPLILSVRQSYSTRIHLGFRALARSLPRKQNDNTWRRLRKLESKSRTTRRQGSIAMLLYTVPSVSSCCTLTSVARFDEKRRASTPGQSNMPITLTRALRSSTRVGKARWRARRGRPWRRTGANAFSMFVRCMSRLRRFRSLKQHAHAGIVMCPLATRRR